MVIMVGNYLNDYELYEPLCTHHLRKFANIGKLNGLFSMTLDFTDFTFSEHCVGILKRT